MNKSKKKLTGYKRWRIWCKENLVGKPITSELLNKASRQLIYFIKNE